MKAFAKIIVALLIILLPVTARAEDFAKTWYAPPGQFNAALQVMDLGLANIFAFFQSSTGSFTFDEQNKSLSKLRVAIDGSSLMATNPQNQNDLANLLGIAQDPEIRFTAPDAVTFKDGKASIKGTLTVHGTSKPVTMEATLNHIGKSPRGAGMWSSEGDAIGLSMRGSFNRADFGMTDNPALPSRFGEAISLQLEMQAIRQ